MPLTNCPDCKKSVSTEAPTCPHCGKPGPFDAVNDSQAKSQKIKNSSKELWLISITIILAIAVWLFVMEKNDEVAKTSKTSERSLGELARDMSLVANCTRLTKETAELYWGPTCVKYRDEREFGRAR